VALACVEWLGEPRLRDCLRRCSPPGISVDRLDAAFRRHDTSLYECRTDAHLRDDGGLERTISRLLVERGTVTIELVERIIKHTRFGPDVYRTDPDLRRAYWAASASLVRAGRTVAPQKPLSASYATRAVRPPRPDRVTTAHRREPLARVEHKEPTTLPSAEGTTVRVRHADPFNAKRERRQRERGKTAIALRLDATDAHLLDALARIEGRKRSAVVRDALRSYISQRTETVTA
jgi:hypothetical protein